MLENLQLKQITKLLKKEIISFVKLLYYLKKIFFLLTALHLVVSENSL